MTDAKTTAKIEEDADRLRELGINEARVQHYIKEASAGRWGRAHGIISKVICGARTHKPGNPPCLCKPLENGRCKWHGGMSTGAKTPEGKARQQAGIERWRERMRRQGWFKRRAKTRAIYHRIFDDD